MRATAETTLTIVTGAVALALIVLALVLALDAAGSAWRPFRFHRLDDRARQQHFTVSNVPTQNPSSFRRVLVYSQLPFAR
jgi:hypothetical protein